MAQAAPFIALAGAGLSAGGSILGANAQAKDLRAQADQLDMQAGKERATSQRQAMEERRQAGLLVSTGVARAAASGAGADDPTVVNLLANISGEGEYRALTALYNGEEQARSDEAQAAARRTEAKNVKRAGWIKGISSILGAPSSDSMLGRYGTMKSSAPMPSLPSAPLPSWQQVGADVEYEAAIQRAKDLAADMRKRQGIK